MRALFTQFSLLLGVLAFLEVNSRTGDMTASVALGVATVCSVYIALLLGDFAIHGYLDEKASAPSSFRFIDGQAAVKDHYAEPEFTDASPSFDERSVRAA